MPVIHAPDAVTHEVHGSTFRSFVAPSTGSTHLCAWQLTVPADLPGAPHRPSREEVLLVLDGGVTVTLDGESEEVGEGDVVLVAPGAELRIDGGPSTSRLWVTTTPGLEAVLADGRTFRPPWAL